MPDKQLYVRYGAIACVSFLLIGCSGGPNRVEVPAINPSRAASQAIELYDTDGDKQLSKEELVKCPSILSAIELYDTNKNGTVEQEEIASRLQNILDERNGLLVLHAIVTLDGRPLSNAKLQFIPEEILEGAISPAEGVTDSTGQAMPAVSPEDFPSSGRFTRAMQPGLYRVEITHDTITLPERYNTNSELGVDVSYRLMDTGIPFDLKSKK